MRKFYSLAVLLAAVFHTAFAQSPTDGLMMPKGQLCILGQYATTSWDEYWEGTNKRSNSNLGTFKSQNIMLMPNYGITDKLNVMAALPYVWTGSDSYLDGQSGLQDLSLWVKYQPLSLSSSLGEFKAQVAGGASIPVTNYVADFLPFSIGFQSKTASLRGILNYTMKLGVYATAQIGHTWRSKVTIDRDSYIFDNELYYTDEVPVPNILDYSARFGFIQERFQAEVWIESFAGLSGDDIRYNEMPFLTNKMKATSLGWFGKGFITRQLALQVSYSVVRSGRNVGKASTIAGGITYFFTVSKPKEEASK